MSRDAAASALSVHNVPDTVLLTVAASTPDPETSAKLANGVAAELTDYVSSLESMSDGGPPVAKITVVSNARPEADPVVPRTHRNVALGFGLGLLVGAVAAYLRYRFDNRVRSVADLVNVVGDNVLSVVRFQPDLSNGPVAFLDGGAPVAEDYRKLRTNLGFVGGDRAVRGIVVSSAAAGDGKSTTAINIASAFAESGSRVLLVDGDLRKPVISERFSLSSEVGFSNVLRGDGNFAEFVQPSGIDGLWILSAGPLPPNPAELLALESTGRIVNELMDCYDYVIFDSAPILPVTDPVVLSRWVGGIVLVVRADESRTPMLSRAISEVHSGDGVLLGTVLNGVTLSDGYYGESLYYGKSADGV
ncbi:capsular exopolysaccharide biosynthesis protein [Mycobacteroides abscessus subsp. abscessus]|nr:capsular exopolysaccharide biosynthesis protein [Mycobacteroides abscessus subsp. abscessus]